MTDEQRQRIHDITYSTDDRMELAERIVRLEDEIDKQKFKFEVLKAHGIKIVDAVGGGHEIYDTRQREVDRLEYENAKLRELATEAIRLIQAESPDCGLCKHYDECWAGEAMNYSPSGCVICNEARELGIEVE